jgi:hypothetical protein
MFQLLWVVFFWRISAVVAVGADYLFASKSVTEKTTEGLCAECKKRTGNIFSFIE